MALHLPRRCSLGQVARVPSCLLVSSSLQRLSPGFALHSSRPSRYATKAAPVPVEYGYVDGVEDLQEYRKRGYHPVHIGDRLAEKRYQIVHKLGHGTYSTAWLAVDEKTSDYVAIKIGTADSERTEVDVLSRLTRDAAGRDELQHSLIPALLNRFKIDGPNGTHTCTVTLPARGSLRDSKDMSTFSLLPLDVARSLAAQLVMAVAVIHSSGYAHGDLHLGNILLQLPSSLKTLSVEELYAKHGRPEKEPVVRLDTGEKSEDPGVPSYAVPPVQLGISCCDLTLAEARLLLTDFGAAFRPSDGSRFESYTPLVLRPPDAFFETTVPLTFASDIWSLGCVLFELFAHRSLIDGFLAPDDEIIAQQVALQGRLPPDWWAKWKGRAAWFDDEGRSVLPPTRHGAMTWERRFEEWVQEPRGLRGQETVGHDEQVALLGLLRWMLALRPEERPDAQQVLGSDWMTRWALPAYSEALDEAHGQAPSAE